ncbi:MAG: glutamate 5-kinase [Actinomycetales bacterium]|nr:glutamate 5-kinase [Actinomycetales bacterium]
MRGARPGQWVPVTPLRQLDRRHLATARRVVVKVGSSSLTGDDGRLDVAALRALVDVLAARRVAGGDVVLVTSGAIASGLAPLGLTARPPDLATAQATASVGQGLLIARYTEAFAAHGLRVGQVLLTAEDTVRRSHYRNALRCLDRLLALGVVPVVNENDTVATGEIRFGENDRLAALVSHLVRADALVLLSDVDALYDRPPSSPGARRIDEVRDPAELADVRVGGRGSKVGSGGMVSKLQSVAIATGSGVPVLITKAELAGAALAGEPVGTWFYATGRRRSARLLWLEHAAAPHGRLVLDEGAVRAVVDRRASLLPAGIVAVEGEFDAGEPVELAGPDGVVIGRGLVAFSSSELPDLLGRSTRELREALGAGYDREVVHRDDLVLLSPLTTRRR